MARKWWTLVVVCTATFMLLLDVTIVNVALPDIQRDLHSSFSDLQWVVDAYTLTLAAFLLTAGSLGDRLGTRSVFAVGLTIFTASSLACALSPTAVALNVARAAQGIGGAMMYATSLALLARAFTGRDRGTAFGVYGATTGAAVAVGPLVGGALTQSLDWRWIFYLNLPLGVLALAITFTTLTADRPAGGRGRVDLPGLVTFSGALALLVLALIRGNDRGWGSGLIVGCLVAAFVLLVAFVLAERVQRQPMLDLALFRVRTFGGAAAAAFALHATIFSVFLYLTLYLQNVLGYGPLAAGLRFLPLTVTAFVAAAVSGPLTERMPRRLLIGAGLLLIGVALLLLRGAGVSTGWTHLIPGFLVGGTGVGMVNPALASTAIDVVPPARSGMASGINSTFRQVGIATGIAALGALFTARIRTGTLAALQGTGISDGTGTRLAGAIGGGGQVQQQLAALPPDRRPVAAAAARLGFLEGLDHILLVAAIVAFAGALVAVSLINGGDQARREPAGGGYRATDAVPGPAQPAQAP